MIQTALDWQKVYNKLRPQINQMRDNPKIKNDLIQMLDNVEKMVTELSKLEVDARRTKNITLVKPQLAKVNQAVDQLEKFILFANLLK